MILAGPSAEHAANFVGAVTEGVDKGSEAIGLVPTLEQRRKARFDADVATYRSQLRVLFP